ncbi:MAG: N-acetyltransferase [Rhizobiales bacterium]|nr:N-acetyltransferase [Hyphomicrobiales bacterium]
MADDVRDNRNLHRFEMQVDGHVAYIRYRREPGTVTLIHTEVPAELGGRGIGKALVQGTLDLIRTAGEKVVPICPFVVAWMKRHPEYDDLRAGTGQH